MEVRLRRTGTVLFGAIGMCVPAGLFVTGIVVAVHRGNASIAVQLTVVAAITASLVYAATIRPAVIIGPTAVVVIQPFWTRKLPTVDIDRVTGARGLTVHMVDGSQVSVWAFSPSLIAAFVGDRHARKAQSEIEAAQRRAQDR
jgi:hypothetical protein